MIQEVTFKKQVTAGLMAGIFFGLSLIPVTVLADDRTPPDDRAPSSGRSSGGRGCGTPELSAQSNVSALILLAPNGYPRQTVSTRPKFAWFVRDTGSMAAEFRLYERENGTSPQNGNRFKLVTEIKDDNFKTAPGITVLSLTQSYPELTVGKQYRWQVEIVCDPSRPSSNIFATSDIEIVPTPLNLKTQLERAKTSLERATLYEQANLWYDLLGVTFTSESNDAKLKTIRLSLLDKIGENDKEWQMLRNSEIYLIQR
ncbi:MULTISPECIES: DUF928 domain-containing protein [Nostocales]|uniref:DUF928 domain-containing protein n=3 Tax=Nostocales TaxID=1161 RepID=A0A0C1MY47_9CYAN|nr:DUF928 domain-containing protein [Tolypothrix bouteillei]KAF3889276.1 DUF928 domain-containing protein [Tolypothrix bouteillei VB521301]